MNKADFLSQHKPKVEKIEVDGKIIYLRELTVGDNNFIMFETQAYMLQRAKQLGIEIDMSNGTQIEAQLKQVEDPYMLARQAAMRICDEEGNLLFDFKNVDDLDKLNGLGQSFLTIFQDSKKKS